MHHIKHIIIIIIVTSRSRVERFATDVLNPDAIHRQLALPIQQLATIVRAALRLEADGGAASRQVVEREEVGRRLLAAHIVVGGQTSIASHMKPHLCHIIQSYNNRVSCVRYKSIIW
jgi:hypothetical protein